MQTSKRANEQTSKRANKKEIKQVKKKIYECGSERVDKAESREQRAKRSNRSMKKKLTSNKKNDRKGSGRPIK